jgi:hypothetical protein
LVVRRIFRLFERRREKRSRVAVENYENRR